jgi:hypothetical protein
VRRSGVLMHLAADDPEGLARIGAFLQGCRNGAGLSVATWCRSCLRRPLIRSGPASSRENSRLRKAVSDLTLDKLILQEAARGNF